jgi:hypothetical protein
MKRIKVCKNVLLKNYRYKVRNINNRYEYMVLSQRYIYDDMMTIYLLTAIWLSPGGSSKVHIYTQTIHRTIQNKKYIEQHNNWKSAGRAPSWLVIS